jgi:Holliday junction resolvase RusA-like endonuclease
MADDRVNYQPALEGLFDDVEEVHLDSEADCCTGDTHHVPHCPLYLETIYAIDDARVRALEKNPRDGKQPPLQTIQHLRLTVAGLPAPQGSKDAFPIWEGRGHRRRFTGKVALVEVADAKVKAWRRAVKRACEGHRKAYLPRAPLVVECLFSVPRPETVTPEQRLGPVVPPDVDKYLRGTLDALVLAEVFPDDGQVLRATGEKHYAGQGRGPLHPGAYITISRALL